VLLGELPLLVDRVAADPDPLRAHGRELGGEVPEVTALLRAAHRHRGGVEEEHDRSALEQDAQRARRPRLVGQREVVDDVSAFHPGNVPRGPDG
jgi:hypothetical protein